MIRWERLGALAPAAVMMTAFGFIVWGVWGFSENAGRIAIGVALALLLFVVERKDDADAASQDERTAQFRTGVTVR
jgi:hypothetical protein